MLNEILIERPVRQWRDAEKKEITAENRKFYDEVIDGLSRPLKQLPSKYFYDAAGDRLFQEIMSSEDYYVTNCEMEIFVLQTKKLVTAILERYRRFQLVELGPGDCIKSVHLLKALLRAGADFDYVPIDISENVIDGLEISLPPAFPSLRILGMNGEYFQMLDKLNAGPDVPKVVLCLGANIGNMTVIDSHAFCQDLRSRLSPGDLVVIGFDLVKDPHIIRAAYDDRQGITSRFNLNLLRRMNRELHADFNPGQFAHYCSYEPGTGACKSYLISKQRSEVQFPEHKICFDKDECIWMEISQKYTLRQIGEMAAVNGFRSGAFLLDSKGWFTDAIWVAE